MRKAKRRLTLRYLLVCLACLATSPGSAGTPHPNTSFFVTSVGNGEQGGNYNGIQGADARCNSLAAAANLPPANWAAYLSTAFVTPVNARDRIGSGPWHNVAGMLIATSVDDLHLDGLASNDALDEFGNAVPFEEHDILTGSAADGTVEIPDAFAGFLLATCNDYTSNNENDFVSVGHVDGDGVGDSQSQSWNSAHLSACNQAGLNATLGSGRLYCFATDAAPDLDLILTSDFE